MIKDDIKQEKDSSDLLGKWYAINCYSGHEEKVKEDLLQRVETLNMKDFIFDVRIVKQQEMSKKTKSMIGKNPYPGYLFVNMIMNDDAWFIVRNTPGVTGFIGSSGNWSKPFPLSRTESRDMLRRSEEKSNISSKKVQQVFVADFKEGDLVKILSGAFENKEGEVIAMDYSKGVATINIEVFGGRYVPVEAEFSYCEKVN
ncbi:transcription termination/antitermination protein NusG [Spiroplasma endosymbiont of 'Nebria riversi']|uniref:transcription termination/antitermination protein NusG n=1 Tax=Spiroplasma endosymbiont of 'Nebria riversi' TaxID=2792084 RepID=UPI001C051631|nr:transcription termination/antitermination protein NusG [Spiroplasma endosymbiont of 'Nebria riversi']